MGCMVNQLDQTIITATDEVFDSLGYRPSDLMGHSILTLALQQQQQQHQYQYQNQYNQHQNQHQHQYNQLPSSCRRYYARHAARGQVSLEICVHHDPFGATDSLDYWLIRLNDFAPQPATVLRLSPYGTIEYCQPAPSFHQLTSEMLGRPIMGFIHSDDVPAFCAHLNNTAKSKTHAAKTFRTRWSKYALQDLPEDYNNTKHYDWMSLTAVTTGHRSGCPTDAFQCRPLCILQPVPGETVMEQARRVCIEYLQGMVGQCADFSSSAMDMVTIAVIEVSLITCNTLLLTHLWPKTFSL
ncbi:hypothetical protein CLU79DRAFT_351430 [Phycomyces nitens]|nr:hypothetical protein CLU79DRAFT_351430 [Phycomyces nitens]